MSDSRVQLAAIILTYNEEDHIAACIESVRWADRIVVFDSYSSDTTAAIAQECGAVVMQHVFENYGAQRNAALDQIDAEWVVFVDADERATMELGQEIRSKLALSERGWRIPRHNFIFGRLTLGAGWYPDYQTRVLHRTSARYDSGRPVHEEVVLNGEYGTLEHPLIHHNYANLSHFIAKQERYTDIEATIRYDKGLRPRLRTFVTSPLRQFWWRFVTLKGYSDGLHGLRLSLLMAYYEFRAWRRVARLWNEKNL